MYEFGNVKEGGYFIDGSIRWRRVPKATSSSGVFNAVSMNRQALVALYAEDDEVEDIPFRGDRKSQLPLEDIFDEFRSRISDVRENALGAAERGDETMAGWYEEDAEDLDEILEAASEGKWSRAYRMMRLIDTAVREYIPREMMHEIHDRVSEQEKERDG